MPVTPTIEVDDTLKDEALTAPLELPTRNLYRQLRNLPFPLQPLA